MNATLIMSVILGYFLILIIIARITGKSADNASFFVGSKSSKWYLVAFGMIGTSLSGVTFISVPGTVDGGMYYFQIVLGYLVGYFIVAFVLLPLYYKLNLTSIYSYLKGRFGNYSYKTGAIYFLISRVIGAAIRLVLVTRVMQEFIFDDWNVPFEATVAISILLIWIYTNKGGIKTIVWTDTLQTLFMLIAVVLAISGLINALGWSFTEAIDHVMASDYSKTFQLEDGLAKNYFWKNFFAGMFITIAMTGLDQDMMQKNLSCKNRKDAQKNMISFSIVLVFVNALFLLLGALLFLFASEKGIELPANGDGVYPTIALNHLNLGAGLCFIIGLVAAAYSSADSALTALTTSFSIDILEIESKSPKQAKRIRQFVHIGMSIVLYFVIILLNQKMDKGAIFELLGLAALTYGPLVGLYAFGILTKYQIKDSWVPIICIIPPVLTYYLKSNWISTWIEGYEMGSEAIIYNGIFTFTLLFLSITRKTKEKLI